MSAFRGTCTTLLLVLLASCAELTAPTREQSEGETGAPAQAAPTRAMPRPRPAPSAGAQRPLQPPDQEWAEASHILVAYKDAPRSRAERSKEEALKLAEEVAAKAKRGEDFTALAAKYSDDPRSKQRGGSLGPITRRRMIKSFADATFDLKPGEVSGVVETPFGYHVIKRTR